MARWWRWTALGSGAALVALAGFIGFCFYTPPGHDLTATLIERLSGGEVSIQGLGGDLPGHLRASRVELRDRDGVWLTAEDVDGTWSLWPLLNNKLEVARLRAAQITMARRRRSSDTSSTSHTTVDIADFAVARIVLAAPVLGQGAVLTASGGLHYVSRHDVAADLAVRRLDGVGHYTVRASIAGDVAQGMVRIRETGAGLAGGLIGLPQLGAVRLDIDASLQGSSNRLALSLDAGPLQASGGGTLDLKNNTADLDVTASAPAMQPAADLAWQSLAVRGHVRGPLTTPEMSGDVRVRGLMLAGHRIETLTAVLQGAGGRAHLALTAEGVRLKGDKAGIFAAGQVTATADADLDSKNRVVRFSARHPAVLLEGETTTRGPLVAQAQLTLPDVAKLAGLTGLATSGRAVLTANVRHSGAAWQIKTDGTLAAKGDSVLARLLGTATLTGTASVRDGRNLSLDAAVRGAAAKLAVKGGIGKGVQDFSGTLEIADLSRLTEKLIGSANLAGKLAGPSENGRLTLNGTAQAAPKGVAKQTVTLTARADGLPRLKSAMVTLAGRFGGAPLSLKTEVTPAGGDALKIALQEARWKSLRADGVVTIAGTAPHGSVHVEMARLSDLSVFAGVALGGSVTARADFTPAAMAVRATGSAVVYGKTVIARMSIDGTIADPLDKPVLGLAVAASDIDFGNASGSVNLRLNGPLRALGIGANGEVYTARDQEITLAGDAVADLETSRLTMNRLETAWRGQSVKLAAPAMVDFADGVKFAARFVSGKSGQVSVNAILPMRRGQALTVRVNGHADLGMLGNGLAATGQSVRGTLGLDVVVTGTLDRPMVDGSATLSGGQIQDYAYGVNLSGIEAAAEAHGSLIRLTRFSAKAPPGSIAGSGTIDLAALGTPVDLAFTARDARPIMTDMVRANLDADLRLSGRLADRLTLSGSLGVRQGTINIPDKFPAQLPSLNVRRSRGGPPPSAPAPVAVALDIAVSSPGRVFVRGRGLDVELEGDLKIAGSSDTPVVLGALTMRRGTLSVPGADLTFQSGNISFDGDVLRRRFDPSLDFVAETEANGVTATLKVTGTASQPKIALSSSPAMPQDEILAQLLFQQSARSLSPVQLASLAQTAASLGGGVSFDPVGRVRRQLGLDRLAVGSIENASGAPGTATVEAGKYVLHNVYLSARQDFSGGTRATVAVDLAKNLKAQATVNTGPRAATTTPQQDDGDSIGLSYQFDY